jgi:hypothetical protein
MSNNNINQNTSSSTNNTYDIQPNNTDSSQASNYSFVMDQYINQSSTNQNMSSETMSIQSMPIQSMPIQSMPITNNIQKDSEEKKEYIQNLDNMTRQRNIYLIFSTISAFILFISLLLFLLIKIQR